MAKGFLGVEVADATVRYIYLEKQDKHYSVIRAGKSSEKFNESEEGSLFKVLNALLAYENVNPKRIFISISRRDIVIHQIILPKMAKKEMEEVISGEIEKIPSFYHRGFDYIHRSFPFSQEKERIVFGALSQKLLNFVISEVKKTKIYFRDLDIAPLNLKDILPLPKASKRIEACIVVHDHQTYLSIFEKKQYKLLYKSSLGIDHITTAASKLGQEHVIASLTAELKRALKSFLSDNKKAELSYVWLIWDKELVFDLDKRLAKDLGLDVEVLYLKKIPDITVKKEHHLNPVFIIPLTPILFHIRKLKPQFPFTHFFRGIQVKKYFIKAAGYCVVFLILLGIAFSQIYLNLLEKNNTVTKELAAFSREQKVLEKEAKELYKKEKEYEEIRQRLLLQATYVARLNRVSWSEVFALVSDEMPDNLSLTSFKFSESGRAKIKGQAFDMEAIAGMMRRIEDSETLQKGKFDFLKEHMVEDKKIFDFGILADLLQPNIETVEKKNDKEKNK